MIKEETQIDVEANLLNIRYSLINFAKRGDKQDSACVKGRGK
jgi:hypothetical protein